MSLVTTATFTVSRSSWHSASTLAVLPEPTGPAMPMRTAPFGSIMSVSSLESL